MSSENLVRSARTEETNNRDKIIWDWWEDISINRQHINETKKQKTHKQEHWVIYDQEKYQEIKLWTRLTSRNANTLSISCINTSTMQSVHITSNHINVCWTQKQIWSWEHSRKKND